MTSPLFLPRDTPTQKRLRGTLHKIKANRTRLQTMAPTAPPPAPATTPFAPTAPTARRREPIAPFPQKFEGGLEGARAQAQAQMTSMTPLERAMAEGNTQEVARLRAEAAQQRVSTAGIEAGYGSLGYFLSKGIPRQTAIQMATEYAQLGARQEAARPTYQPPGAMGAAKNVAAATDAAVWAAVGAVAEPFSEYVARPFGAFAVETIKHPENILLTPFGKDTVRRRSKELEAKLGHDPSISELVDYLHEVNPMPSAKLRLPGTQVKAQVGVYGALEMLPWLAVPGGQQTRAGLLGLEAKALTKAVTLQGAEKVAYQTAADLLRAGADAALPLAKVEEGIAKAFGVTVGAIRDATKGVVGRAGETLMPTLRRLATEETGAIGKVPPGPRVPPRAGAAETIEIGDVITTKLRPIGVEPTTGVVTGEGLIGKVKIPGWRIQTAPGKWTVIAKEEARILAKGRKPAPSAVTDLARLPRVEGARGPSPEAAPAPGVAGDVTREVPPRAARPVEPVPPPAAIEPVPPAVGGAAVVPPAAAPAAVERPGPGVIVRRAIAAPPERQALPPTRQLVVREPTGMAPYERPAISLGPGRAFEPPHVPPPDIPADVGGIIVPPEPSRGRFLGDLLSHGETVGQVVTSENKAVQWLAGRTGINPSVLSTDPVAKGIVAFYRRIVAAREMTEVALASALDTHAQRVTGRMGRVLPIDQKTGFLRGTQHPWQDVFSNPDAYTLDSATRAYIDDFNRLIGEMSQRLRDRGLAPLQVRNADGTFYVPRQVKSIRGVELRRPSNPKLQRVYEAAEEGFEAGVRYDVNPRATARLYLQSGWRQIVVRDFEEYLAANATFITPKQLVSSPVVERLIKAASDLRSGQSKLAALQRERLRLQTGGEFRGEAAKAQRVLRHERQALVKGNAAAIAEARSNLVVLRAEYNSRRYTYARALERARQAEVAPGNLFGRAEDTISIKQWHNRFFPVEQAKALEDGLRQLGIDIPTGVVGGAFSRIANTMRTGASFGDFVMPFMQGLPVLGRNPAAWAKMTARHYEAFFDPVVQARVIRDNLEDFQWMARNGVPIGDPEFFAGAIQGQGLPLMGWLELLPKGAEGRNVIRQFGRQTVGRFQASYNTGLGTARMYLLKAQRGSWTGTDAELAQYLRNMTGGLDSRALGVGPTQRGVEALWLAFSPRLLRSTLALVKDAMNPTTAVGRASLRSLAQLVAGVTGVYIIAGVALGKTWEEIRGGLNPLNGKRFLSHNINGDWIGVGGQTRAIVQVLARVISALAPGGEPAGSLVSGGLFDNPLIQALYYRGAPGINIAGAGIEFLTGADVMPFDKIDSLPDLAKFFGKSTLPFAVQGSLEGEQALTTGAALVFARTSPGRLSDLWRGDFKDYDAIPTDTSQLKEGQPSRIEYRQDNPEIDAKLFIRGRVTSLQSEEAMEIAARLIQEHNIDPNVISGISKRKDTIKKAVQPLDLEATLVDDLIDMLGQKQQSAAPSAPSTPQQLPPTKSRRFRSPPTPEPVGVR